MGAVAPWLLSPGGLLVRPRRTGAQGVKGPSPELVRLPQVRSYLTVCTCGERTVMGISVHTAETEMA